MLLHNGNSYASIPIGHFTTLKEQYQSIKIVLQKLAYEQHQWHICVDFKMVNFLLGQQAGYTNFLCQISANTSNSSRNILSFTTYLHIYTATPKALCSNIVYQFSCACDVHLSYFSMSSRHLSTRAKEHLNLADSRKSAIKDHLYSCDICSNNLDMDSFTILKKCNSEYKTKIHEAPLIKKRGPKLNKQVYASDASFLLDIFKIIIILYLIILSK